MPSCCAAVIRELEIMNRRILITSLHPGAGKTSLCANLGGYLANRGFRVEVLDGGSGRPIGDWLEKLPQLPIVPLRSERGDLARLRARCSSREEDQNWEFSLIEAEAPTVGALIPACDPVQVWLVQPLSPIAAGELQSWSEQIDLVVPNFFAVRDYRHSAQGMELLAGIFGLERISDPIPT